MRPWGADGAVVRVASPSDVKLVDIDEPHPLCRELRDFLIGSVAAMGGHLAYRPAQGTTVLALTRASDEQLGVGRPTRRASFSHSLMRLGFNGATDPAPPGPRSLPPNCYSRVLAAGHLLTSASDCFVASQRIGSSRSVSDLGSQVDRKRAAIPS